MTKTFSIGDHIIGAAPCYVIAEIGSNHDKDKARAFDLIKKSARAGADAAKFQLFKTDKIASCIDIPETKLKNQFAKFGKNLCDLYRDMELPDSWLQELRCCCQENKIDFLATPFDEKSADQLAKAGVMALKVASFEITHIPLLKHIATLKLPVLISTGMANLSEIAQAVQVVENAREERIGLFHCGIDYPQTFETVNLRCMETMRTAFPYPIGYSDHTRGITVPIAAVALGATLYEKHVTLPHGTSPDHDFAITTDELEHMVRGMRECELSLGTATKGVQSNELEYRRRGRRSIFLTKSIKKGESFTKDNLDVLRPGVGLHPELFETILGKKAANDIIAPAMIKVGDWE